MGFGGVPTAASAAQSPSSATTPTTRGGGERNSTGFPGFGEYFWVPTEGRESRGGGA